MQIIEASHHQEPTYFVLPNDCMIEIFRFLEDQDLIRCQYVSKRFFVTSNSPKVWKELYEGRFRCKNVNKNLLESHAEVKESVQEQNPSQTSWKQKYLSRVYEEKYLWSMKWRQYRKEAAQESSVSIFGGFLLAVPCFLLSLALQTLHGLPTSWIIASLLLIIFSIGLQTFFEELHKKNPSTRTASWFYFWEMTTGFSIIIFFGYIGCSSIIRLLFKVPGFVTTLFPHLEVLWKV